MSSRKNTSPTPAATLAPEPLAHRLAGLMIDDAPPAGRSFTPDEARRTLPLVSRIAADAAAEWGRAKRLHDDLGALGRDGDRHERRRLSRRLVECVRRLESLSDEAASLGVDLSEYRTGSVTFLSEVAGRTVLLSWRLGEDDVTHYHDLREVADRRRPLTDLAAA